MNNNLNNLKMNKAEIISRHAQALKGQVGTSLAIDECEDIMASMMNEAINFIRCSTQLPSIIEIDFDGHLKCQIKTTDKAPTILKAVNGYGQPVDCKEGKIRINEI